MNNLKTGKGMPSGIMLVVHGLVAAIAVSILLAYALSFIVFSFDISAVMGLRSLAAAILPVAAILFVSYFTNFFQLPRRVPVFNLYFIFSVWTIFLLIFARRLYGFAIPIGELLFSVTLAATCWRYGRHSFSAFISCCYGVLTGALIYVTFLLGLSLG